MRTRHFCTLIAALLLAVPLTARDTAGKPFDWPQWRGPNRDGVSKETGLLKEWPKEGPRLLWVAKNVGRGYSSVAVASGRIFTLSDRGRACVVLAFDEGTGTELWATRSAPAQGDGPHCTPRGAGHR